MEHLPQQQSPNRHHLSDWRTTKTHSHEQMAECYRQLFFFFGQPMLRKASSASSSTTTTHTASSTNTPPADIKNLRTAAAFDDLYRRHVAVTHAIATDTVISTEKKKEESEKQEEGCANGSAAASVTIPSNILSGTLYDSPLSSSSSTNNNGSPTAKLPNALIAHLPFSFVESIFKSFGQVDYFHFEPERGVGTVIFRSGIDGEVCYATKHLTCMVVPSIAHMRGEGRGDEAAAIDIDDVFSDKVKQQNNGQQQQMLPQLVPVTMYLEFASFLPFFNPALVANASEGSGVSRHLLRTFPVSYRDDKEEAEKRREQEDKKHASSSHSDEIADEDWQLKPFKKAIDGEGNATLPFQRVWRLAIDSRYEAQRNKMKQIEGAAEGSQQRADDKEANASIHSVLFKPIQQLILEELMASRMTAAVANESGTASLSSTLPPNMNVMDLWVAYACRFVLWKPSFGKSVLETAGIFQKDEESVVDGDEDDDDVDDILFRSRIADANLVVLSLALRSSTSFTDVMNLLSAVTLNTYREALERYLIAEKADTATLTAGTVANTQFSTDPVEKAKRSLALHGTYYTASTRRGMNLRRRLAFREGYSVGSNNVSSREKFLRIREANASSEVRRKDRAEGHGTSPHSQQDDNLVLQRLRVFHYDELMHVHYPNLATECRKYRSVCAATEKETAPSSASASILNPIGSGEKAFYALARRLVEDETVHCAIANVQYKLRAQNDASLAYWWLELKLRKLASSHQTITETEKKRNANIDKKAAKESEDQSTDNTKDEKEEADAKNNTTNLAARLPTSVWGLHTYTADFSTRMGLEDPTAILFIASSSLVQLGLNAIDNTFLLMHMARHPNGLPQRLLLQEKKKDPTAAHPTDQQQQQQAPFTHLPPAQFPDVLSMLDEYAASGSAASLYCVLVPPAWFMCPAGGCGFNDSTKRENSTEEKGSDFAQLPASVRHKSGGLGASLLAQQQRYSGAMGMLVMLYEFVTGPLKIPFIGMWSIGLVALIAVWAAGG